MKMHNSFEFYTEDKDGNKETVGKAYNAVLAEYYNLMNKFNIGNLYQVDTIYVYASDTDLFPVPMSSIAFDHYDETEKCIVVVYNGLLAPTDYNGKNISMVGLGCGSIGSKVTKANIVDANGNQISIAKTSDMKLYVKATAYFYDPVYTDINKMPPNYLFSSEFKTLNKTSDYGDFVATYPMWISKAGKSQINSVGTFVISSDSSNVVGLNEMLRGANIYRNIYGNANIFLNAASGLNGTKLRTFYYYLGDYYSSLRYMLEKIIPPQTVLSAINLGTGDGTTTKFKLPHSEVIDLTTNQGTFSILKKKYDYSTMACHSNVKSLLGNNFNVPSTCPFIPYKDGYMQLVGGVSNILDSTKRQMLAVYYHTHASFPGKIFTEPVTIDLDANFEIFKNEQINLNVVPFPDYSALMFKIKLLNGIYKWTYIYEYDKLTGTIGKCLYHSGNNAPVITEPWHNFEISKDMQYMFVSCPEAGTLKAYTMLRTNDAITFTLAKDMSSLVPSTRYMCPQIGIWIEDYVMLYSHYRYKIDLTTLTFSQDSVAGYNSASISPNFMCNVTNISGYTGTVNIYKRDGTLILSDTITAKLSWNNADIFEFGDRVFIHIYGTYRAGVFAYTYEDGVLTRQNPNPRLSNSAYYAYIMGVMNSSIKIGDVELFMGVPMVGGTNIYNLQNNDDNVPGDLTCVFERINKEEYVVFDTPPAAGSAVVVNYKLNYIPKDENWTLNIHPSVSFGAV